MPQVWQDLILNLEPSRLVTLIGGGGKTSLMYYLAGLLKAGGHTVIATATTKLAGREQPGFRFAKAQSLEQAAAQVARARQAEAVTLVSGPDAGNPAKMTGVPPAWLDALAKQFSDTFFIVEGDGAAGRPLKGHQAHEPVIPEASRLVVAVIGVDVLGQPLSAEWVHRPERVSNLTGLPLKAPVTEAAVVRLLLHPEGYLRNCPEHSMVIPFINKAETPAAEARAESLAGALLAADHPKIGGVIVGSVQRGTFRLIRPNQH